MRFRFYRLTADYCIGDVTIEYADEAQKYQSKIEETLKIQLEIPLKPGDLILTSFDHLSPRRSKKSNFRR